MIRKILLPILFFLVAALSGCREKQVLAPVREVVGVFPDSALVLLDGIERASLSAKGRADYDRLSAEAFYRTYGFLDDDHASALRSSYLFAERERSRAGFLLLLAVAILSTLVLYFWARKSQTEKLLLQKQTENDQLMSTAEDLQKKLSTKPVAWGSDTLDRLCEQYYVYEGTSSLQAKVLKEVKDIVEGLRSDPKVQKSLEDSLNQTYGGIIKQLRDAFPKWKEEDFLLYCFVAQGFSSATISTLLEKDKPYVYNRIYRLKERIKASDSPDADAFLALLGK